MLKFKFSQAGSVGYRSFRTTVAALVCALAVSGISIVQPAVSSADGVTAYMFDSGKLRFGGGGHNSTNYSTAASVHAPSGMLQQPFYLSPDGNWYRLNFDWLSTTLGSGTGTGHWTGGTVPTSAAFDGMLGLNTLTDLQVTAEEWSETRQVDGVSAGTGTLVATGTVELNGQQVRVTNRYSLGADASFIQIRTSITNLDQNSIDNVHMWAGTRDDYVGTSDRPTKTRGLIEDGVFVQIPTSGTPSNALKITSGAEGVLFYSTTLGTNTVMASCCSFSNTFNRDPADAPIEETGDGSYAVVLPVGDLAPQATSELVWFYAAGPIADLDAVIADVADAAGATSDLSVRTDTAATIDYTVAVSGTTSYLLVPAGSVAPTPAQIIAAVAYGEPSVIPVATGTQTVVADVGVEIEFTALSAAGSYVAYLVTSKMSEVAVVEFTTRAGAPSQWAATSGVESVNVVITPGPGAELVTNYAYSTDNGGSWTALSPASTTGVFSITGLQDDLEYLVMVRAMIDDDAGMPTAAVSVIPGQVVVPPVEQPPAPVAPTPTPTPTPTPAPSVVSPPTRPVAVINGAPTEVRVSVPIAELPSENGVVLAPTTVEMAAGPVRAVVQVPGAGQIRETDGAVVIEVVRDRAGQLVGEGARPGSTVRAMMHTVAGEARSVAQITVAEEGSYVGEMVFDGTADNAPLPIGSHVLRLVVETTSGEELAIDVVIEITQPDPRPERLWSSGEIPVAVTGVVMATNAGGPETVSVEFSADEGRTRAVADGWSMALEVSGDAGNLTPTDTGTSRIEIVQDSGAEISGDGFMAFTRVDVWIFSTPVLLGSVTIGPDGTFTGSMAVGASVVAVGEHTLQLQGVGTDGYVRSLNVGVVVASSVEPLALPAAGAGHLTWRIAILLIGFGGIMTVIGAGRPRKSTQAIMPVVN